jgi:transcriptional regulator with XRE-family HTH domain
MSDAKSDNKLDHVRLRQARQAARLTQHKLAEKIGVDQSYISYLEKQDRGISFAVLKRLVDGLGVSMGYLAGQVSEPAPDPYQVDDPLEVIRGRYDLPEGLRDLAAAGDLLEILHIQPAEWRALIGLATHWSQAHLVRRDGWVQILFTLRAAGPPRDTVAV